MPPKTRGKKTKTTPSRSSSRARKPSAAVVSVSQADSDNESKNSASTSSTATTTARRDRLPAFLEKLLLQEIEKYGIQNIGRGRKHSLLKVLNNANNPSAFGVSGDGPQRRKIIQRVEKLKQKRKKSEASYLLKLAKYKIQPFAARDDSEEFSDGSSISGDYETGDRTPSKPPSVITTRKESALLSPQTLPSFDPNTSIHSIAEADIEDSPAKPAVKMNKNVEVPRPGQTLEIAVDIDNPENNREFDVFWVPDLDSVKVKDKEVNGYAIMLPMQLNWVRSDPEKNFYKARVYSDEILSVTVPANDWDLIKGKQWGDSTVPPKVHYAINNYRDKYKKNNKDGQNSRMWKTYLLRFPSGHKLSASEVYKEAGVDEELDVDFVKVFTNSKHSCYRYYALWCVANMAKDGFARGEEEETDKILSKNALKLQRMRLLDDSDEEGDQNMGNKPKPNSSGKKKEKKEKKPKKSSKSSLREAAERELREKKERAKLAKSQEEARAKDEKFIQDLQDRATDMDVDVKSKKRSVQDAKEGDIDFEADRWAVDSDDDMSASFSSFSS